MVAKPDSRIRIIQMVFIMSAMVLVMKAAQIQLFDTSFQVRADATAIEKHVV